MKKRAASIALVLSIILSFTCQAGAVDASAAATETQLDAVKSVLLGAGMQTRQFPSDNDYIQMAKSLTIIGDNFKADAECTADEKAAMQSKATQIGLKTAIENGEPLFVNGVAQPIFPYTSGVPTKDGYSNDKSDIIRYSVYVETNYDTDGDGKLDLVKALVQIPRAAAEGKYKAAAIYDARPYITGCTDNGDDRKFTYKEGDLDYDLNSLYGSAKYQRVSNREMSTMDAAKKAKAEEWYYVSPYESGSWGDFYDYEDLDWYDYFLVRGYAVVEVGGLGTRGSEGLETCGADVETDAFKCVVEWLAQNSRRVAYTDKENNIQIKADWSNGNVAMTGRSYGGTTDFAVASTGVANLKTIVPVAGIASWYEYTNSQGISTGSNPAYSDNLGFYCAGRYIDEDDWKSMKDVYQKYLNRIYNDQMTLNGDYGTHWATRDYTAGNDGKRVDAAKNIQYSKFSCPALIVHGLNDDNVRTKQFQLMYDAFKNANQNVKLLLHQGAHITPDYDSHKTSLLIGDETYNGILNKWFSHYLYDQKNGAEDMKTVTVQSNIVDGGWSTSDTWPTSDEASAYANTLTLTNNATGTTTINSNMTGISSWRDAFTTASTSASAMYTYDVKADTVIKGTVKVNISAAPIQHPDKQAVEAADFEAVEAAPRGVDHEEIMNPDNQVADEDEYDAEDEYGIAVMRAGSNSRDALMMSAMLVDVSDEAFQSYTTSVTENKTGAVNWVGSGAEDYDVIKFEPTTSKYKIIARGWIDLANPGAGFSSASAADEVRLEDGKYRNYTVYLQPNYYTVKAGHKLALVVYTYEPGKVDDEHFENYGITIDNAALSAVIPVENGQYTATMSAVDNKYCVSTSAKNGKVTGLESSVVAAGTEVTLTATADSGYDFSGWMVNGEAVEGGATKTFTINGNTTITANFTVHHSSSGGGSSSGSSTTVSTSKSDNGSVSIDKTSASKGSTVTVTVKAKDGYKLDKLTITDAKGNAVDVTDKGNGKFSFVMPEGKVTVTPTFVADNGGQTESKSFSDVKTGDWYADAVKYVSDKGLMSGTGSDKFAPSATTTRAMLMTVLARYAGEDTTGGATWYEKGMNWAKANGVSDGTNPNANITREQLVTMMYRYAGSPKADGKFDSFSDAASVSTYAADAMQWAVANGIVNGSNGKLNPQDNATRAEVAAILMRFCEMSK